LIGGIEVLALEKGVFLWPVSEVSAPNPSSNLLRSFCTKLCSDPCRPYSFNVYAVGIAVSEVLKRVIGS
jgi:hypothetical protein